MREQRLNVGNFLCCVQFTCTGHTHARVGVMDTRPCEDRTLGCF